MNRQLELLTLPTIPLVAPGDDLASIIIRSLAATRIELAKGDLFVVAQKIVSKAEDRYVDLTDIQPGREAQELSKQVGKDARLVQMILSESIEVVRQSPGVIIVRHRSGYVHANAGIDQSNIDQNLGETPILLLPEDSDRSAARLRNDICAATGIKPAIIINDSTGRAFRNGTVGIALGTAGFDPVSDRIGSKDLYGRELMSTDVAVADELAAAASFLMGQADEATPVVLIRGAQLPNSDKDSRSLIREREKDLFR